MEICSRHLLVFGKKMQQRISSMRLGVVSVGGLGSILIEQLMRLFPQMLVYIDRDHIEQSNLNRLINANHIDSRLSIHKVDHATRNILEFNAAQEIRPITGDFLESDCQEAFKDCDFVFGASDSNAVRLAANRLCLAHGIPYLDCGVGALVEDGVLQAAGAQIIKITPEAGFCLHCAELFDVKPAITELLSDEELDRQRNQGYVKGLEIAAPQVYSLNMMAAAWAVWIFMRMAAGDDVDFDGLAIDAKDYRAYSWNEENRNDGNCPTCGTNGIVLGGDNVDLLTRELSTVNVSLIEPQSTSDDHSESVYERSD
jgi:hypothetical protein